VAGMDTAPHSATWPSAKPPPARDAMSARRLASLPAREHQSAAPFTVCAKLPNGASCENEYANWVETRGSRRHRRLLNHGPSRELNCGVVMPAMLPTAAGSALHNIYVQTIFAKRRRNPRPKRGDAHLPQRQRLLEDRAPRVQPAA
jgi:hypothetical protein